MLDLPAEASQTAPGSRKGQGQPRPPLVERADPAALSGAAILAILRRHKLALFAPMLLVPLLAYVAITQISPRYTATGTLLYDASEYKVRELQSILRVDPITEAVMASQAEILHGMPIIERVTNQLGLNDNPEFNPTLRPPSFVAKAIAATGRLAGTIVPWFAATPDAPAAPLGPAPEPKRNATLLAVQAAFEISPLKASHVLQVSFTAGSPVLAAAAVNMAMDGYVRSQLAAKHRAVDRATAWLTSRVKELRAEVRAGEDHIAAYRASQGLVQGMHAGVETEQISHQAENLAHARSDLAAAEGRLDAARGHAGAAAQAAIAPSVVQLRVQQGALNGQLQSMLGRLGPNHPDVLSLRSQLGELQRGIAAEIARVVAAGEAEVRADRANVAALEQDMRVAQGQSGRDSLAEIPLNAMQRDVEASRTLLLAVLEHIQETAQQDAIEAPDAHEISLALPPTRASYPRTVPWMAAAGASGVLFGVLLVYLFELANSTFRSGEDIRAVLGLPCFALVPRITRRALGRLTVEDYAIRKPRSAFAEQLRALRAGLWQQPNRPRIIAVTAARPAEGKTATALALGRLAAMNGERVILLDCDIRQPEIGRLMHDTNRSGLFDWLAEQTELSDVIRKDEVTGMDYIPAGQPEANALGLLMSATMARLLQTLRQDYDLVLLDAPPAQAVTDARIVAGLADATLLCVRWRSTPHSNVLNTLEMLEEAHANVVGAVLTHVDVKVHVRSGYADAEVYHPRYGGYFRE
jgi:succinoglycan biosynthesis transport protein ExoP